MRVPLEQFKRSLHAAPHPAGAGAVRQQLIHFAPFRSESELSALCAAGAGSDEDEMPQPAPTGGRTLGNTERHLALALPAALY